MRPPLAQHPALRGVLAVLGGVLLVAAGLKAVSPVGTWSLPVVVVEAAVGVWLLSGRGRTAAWVAAVGTFLVFSLVSFGSATAGRSSCGCLGDVTVNPWLTLVFDLAALAALRLVRPARVAVAALLVAPFRTQWRPLTAAVVTPAVAAVGLYAAFPQQVSARLDALRGRTLVARPAVLDFGPVPVGEPRTLEVEVTNAGDRPVTILGGSSDCACVASDGLPVEIPAGGSVAVPVRLRSPAHTQPGPFLTTAYLVTEADTLTVTLRVLYTPPRPAAAAADVPPPAAGGGPP